MAEYIITVNKTEFLNVPAEVVKGDIVRFILGDRTDSVSVTFNPTNPAFYKNVATPVAVPGGGEVTTQAGKRDYQISAPKHGTTLTTMTGTIKVNN